MITSLMPVKTRFQQKGLSLLETVLALAVGSIIIMAVLVYYQTASDNANRVATVKMVSDISEAVRAYAQSPDYTSGSVNLSMLQASGLLTVADTVNPWSTDPASLQVSTSGNYMGIQFFNVPSAAQDDGAATSKVGGICATLATQLSSSLPFPSPGTMTLDGTTYTFTNPGTAPYYVQVTKPNGSGGNILVAQSRGAAVCQFNAADSTDSTATLTVVMDLS